MTEIQWQGKSVKTPQGALLEIPYSRLAKTIQQEWDKAKKPDPKTMHYTTCAVSVIDIVANKRSQIMTDMNHFIHGDVIYYFDDRDEVLLSHQHGIWDEWKLWAEQKLQTPAKITHGIVAIQQSDSYYKKAIEIMEKKDNWHFYALQNFICICHSWVLGYAVYCGDLSAQRAIEVSHGDNLYQEQQWGKDAQALSERQALMNEMEQMQNYLHLLDN